MDSGTVCTARRRNGTQCLNYAIRGASVCRLHGGSAPQVKRAAQVRLLMAAEGLAGLLVRMAYDDKLPPAVRLAAIRDGLDRAGLAPKGSVSVELDVSADRKKTFEELVEGTLVDVAETDDGEWFVQYRDGTAKVLPASRQGHGDVIMDLDMRADSNVIDAEVVTDEDDDYEPPATRHDRRAFAEVEAGRAAERKRMASGGMSAAERERHEAEAIAELSASTRSTSDPTVARAAYEAALENGATLAEAKEAGRAAAERATDTTGKRRARTTEATITTGTGRRQRRE